MKKIKKLVHFLIKSCLWMILGSTVLLGISRLITQQYAHPRLYSVENVPPKKVAIVFGAGLSKDGSPSPILRDRVLTAAKLYFAGKVEKLLMSGDNRFVDYNEPGAMREYAISLGVPTEDIVLDYAGRRTYDTCYRASYIFGVEEAILVTQSFHLPRALYLCNHIGPKAVGVSADTRVYTRLTMLFLNIRENFAILTSYWDVWVGKPLPVLGKKEPIFPD